MRYQLKAEAIIKAEAELEQRVQRLRPWSYPQVHGYKRIVPNEFFTLMKVYFNMRKYERSCCCERVGKPFGVIDWRAPCRVFGCSWILLSIRN